MSAPAAGSAALPGVRTEGLAAGAGWALLAHVAGGVGLLAGFRLLTEFLPPSVFGTVSLLTALAAFARAAAGFPVLQAALRHHPETAGSGRARLFASVMRGELLRGALLAAGLTALAATVARAAYGTGLLPFVLLAGFLCADLARNFLLDVLNAGRQHAPYAAWAALEAWLRPLLGVAGAVVMGATAAAVVGGYFAAAALLAAVMWAASPLRAARADAAPAPEDRDALRRSMRSFARPLVPLALMGWLTSVGDRWLLGAWAGPAEVGLYAAAYGLVSVPFLAAQGVLELALRPAYFAAASAGDRAAERRLFTRWVALAVGAASLGAAAFAALHGELAALALGPAYRAASPLMTPIALGLAAWLVASALEKACYARKKTGWVLAAQALGAGAFLAAAPPLVLRHGASGAAAAVPIYFGLQLAGAAVAARAATRPPR